MKICKKGLHQYSKELTRCPNCKLLRNSKWKKENPDKVRQINSKWRTINFTKYQNTKINWISLNKEKYHLMVKKWQTSNAERHKNNQKNYKSVNRDKCNAHNAKRRATKLKAMPKWLTKDHIEQIKAIYSIANLISNLMMLQIDVDHIIPLQGKDVSGLHVPWNLQLLTHKDNLRKSNKI